MIGLTALRDLYQRTPGYIPLRKELDGFKKQALEVFSEHNFGEYNDFFLKKLQKCKLTS